MTATMDEPRALLDGIQTARDWQTADQLIQDRVGPDSVVPHTLAVKMLDHHLLRGPLDDAKAEALGRYTHTLLWWRSQEGSLLPWALTRLDGHWDDGRRQRAAQLAAAYLGGAFAEVAGCVVCTAEEALAAMWPQRRELSVDKLYAIQIVHEQLMRIADEGTPMPN